MPEVEIPGGGRGSKESFEVVSPLLGRAGKELLEALLADGFPKRRLSGREELTHVVDVFCEKCVTGIVSNKARCQELVELSMAVVTSLAPKIGYDRAADIAKESMRTGKTVRQICLDKKVLPKTELDRALDPVAMTEPGGTDSVGG